MKQMKIDARVKLNNGIEMPVFGLGVYQMVSGKETREAVLYALEIGYRLIDTASMYGNEKDVGEAIRKSGIPREQIFVTTKLWNSDHGYDNALSAFEKSLKRLGLSYIDLYLIHWPVEDKRIFTWKAFEKLLEQGKCRSIGVSNYMIQHLKELFENSKTPPAVNQVEFSPYLYLEDLLRFCNSHDIRLESYSPLTKRHKLKDPKLVKIASDYSKTPAQILIRWALQKEVIVIPKSSNKKRISENASVFDFAISEEDMKKLDSFNQNLHTSWDPSAAP